MAGMKSHDFDLFQRINESEASVGSREILDEIEAHFSIQVDGSCTSELFGTPDIQEPWESGDGTNTTRCIIMHKSA